MIIGIANNMAIGKTTLIVKRNFHIDTFLSSEGV